MFILGLLGVIAWVSCFAMDKGSRIRYAERGGGSTTIETPQPPAAPSTADAISAWVNSLPQIYETQLQYAPQQAQQQVDLANQYAAQYGQAYKTAQESMYPETVALQEKLAGIADQGMNEQVPDWMRSEYLNNMRAQLGDNAMAGVGADYMSRGLMQMNEDWNRYYQNLGLSVTGRQPLTQASTPSTTDYMSNFSPSSVMGYESSTYSPYAGAYSSMYGTNAQMATANAANPYQLMQGIGNVFGGLGKVASGGGFGSLF